MESLQVASDPLHRALRGTTQGQKYGGNIVSLKTSPVSYCFLFRVFFVFSLTLARPKPAPVVVTTNPTVRPRRAADRCATSVTHGATSRFFLSRPRRLPTCNRGQLCLWEHKNQAGGAASREVSQVKGNVKYLIILSGI